MGGCGIKFGAEIRCAGESEKRGEGGGIGTDVGEGDERREEGGRAGGVLMEKEGEGVDFVSGSGPGWGGC